MGALKIREARTRDALELLSLRRDVLAERRWFIGTSVDHTVEQEIQLIARMRGDPCWTVLVAREGGRLRGMVSLRPPPFERMRHVVKLEVMVEERSRGMGLGRDLMESALVWADEAPISKIGLAVFADNERAIALYRSLGFEEEGRRPMEYRMEDGTFRDDLLLYRFV